MRGEVIEGRCGQDDGGISERAMDRKDVNGAAWRCAVRFLQLSSVPLGPFCLQDDDVRCVRDGFGPIAYR